MKSLSLAGTPIHVGWKAIAKRLGVRDIRTARSLVKRYHLPVYRIGKSPRMDETIFVVWESSLIEITEKYNRAGSGGERD